MTITTGTPTTVPNVPSHPVTTPSGQVINVQGDPERLFYEGQCAKYMSENAFSMAADLLDLDRLVFMELQIYRATSWLGSGRDYYGALLGPADLADCRRTIKELSPLISTVKNDLGMTKNQRDRAQAESVGAYITELKQRAKEHGVNREKQLTKALCLVKELFSLVGTFDRSDEVEREKIGFESADDILNWVRDVMRPEFDAVDEHFRTSQQKFWVRKV